MELQAILVGVERWLKKPVGNLSFGATDLQMIVDYVRKLEEALKPFADAAEGFEGEGTELTLEYKDNDGQYYAAHGLGDDFEMLTVHDLKNAERARFNEPLVDIPQTQEFVDRAVEANLSR